MTGFTVQMLSSHQRVTWRQVLLYRCYPVTRGLLEDRFYCTNGIQSPKGYLKTGFTVQMLSSHQRVTGRQVLLYKWYPITKGLLEDRFYCTNGIQSPKGYLKTGFILVCPFIKEFPKSSLYTIHKMSSQKFDFTVCVHIKACPLGTDFTVEKVPYNQSVLMTVFALISPANCIPILLPFHIYECD